MNNNHDFSTEQFRKALKLKSDRKLTDLIRQKLIYQSLCLNDTVKPRSLTTIKQMKKQQQKSEALIKDSMIRFVTATKLKAETAIA